MKNLHTQKEIESVFEKSSDYSKIESGTSNPKEEVKNLFESLPEGKSMEDKTVFGVFDSNNELCGVIDLVKNYPINGEWTIGLLVLIQEVRGKGLGTKIHEKLKKIAKLQGAKTLRIGVLQDNPIGLSFWGKLGYQKFSEKEMIIGEKRHQVDVERLEL